MPSISCKIKFANPSKVFYSGQLLSGTVLLTATKAKTIKGIYVKIGGRAYCRWSTGAGKARRTHVGEEVYLDEKTYFLGGEDGEVALSPGEHNYSFSCMLPAALPTSVEGKIGHTRYTITVHIVKSFWGDQQFQANFIVFHPLNLHFYRVQRNPPIEREVQKTYCGLLCCVSRELVINGRLSVGGYLPGQIIDISLKIRTREVAFDTFIIRLVKHLLYHTHANSSVTKNEIEVMKTVTCNGCPSNRSKSYNVSMTIPPILPPTDESTSNIVKISYQLHIKGSPERSPNDAILVLPIKIGTHPLSINQHQSVVTQPTTTSPSSQLPGNSFESTTIVPKSLYPSAPRAFDIDPPTYDEATANSSSPISE